MGHKDTVKKMNEDRRVNKLNKKYGEKTYFEKYLPLYYSAIGSSWMFNFISGVGASAFFFFVFQSVIPYLALIIIATFIFIVFWELAKRYLLINLFEDFYMQERWNYGQACIIFVLVGGSVAATFFGAKEMIPKVLPEAELISFSEQSKLLTVELKKAEANLKELKTDKKYRTSKGELMYNIKQYTIPAKSARVDSLSSKLIALQEKITAKNGEIEKDYGAITQFKAWHYSVLFGVSDLLLIFCLWYKEKYEFIEYNERGSVKKKPPTKATSATPSLGRNILTKDRNATSATRNGATAQQASATPVATGAQRAQRVTDATPDPQRATPAQRSYKELTVDELLEKLGSAESNYRSYKSRLERGKGVKATNERGMKRGQEKIALIKAELQKKRAEENK